MAGGPARSPAVMSWTPLHQNVQHSPEDHEQNRKAPKPFGATRASHLDTLPTNLGPVLQQSSLSVVPALLASPPGCSEAQRTTLLVHKPHV